MVVMLPAVGHLILCAVIDEASRQPGSFYRAMLCIRGSLLAMALCPSVCPSVRHKSVFY